MRWETGEGDLYIPASQPRAAMVLVPGAAVLGARRAATAGFCPNVRPRGLRRAGARTAGSPPARPCPAPTATGYSQQLNKRLLRPSASAWRRSPTPLPARAINRRDRRRPRAARRFCRGHRRLPGRPCGDQFVTTGAFRPRGDSREFRLEPNNYGRWAILRANASRLDDARDAGLLEEIALRRFRDRNADISRETAMLGPEGRAVLALVDNRDPDAVAPPPPPPA